MGLFAPQARNRLPMFVAVETFVAPRPTAACWISRRPDPQRTLKKRQSSKRGALPVVAVGRCCFWLRNDDRWSATLLVAWRGLQKDTYCWQDGSGRRQKSQKLAAPCCGLMLVQCPAGIRSGKAWSRNGSCPRALRSCLQSRVLWRFWGPGFPPRSLSMDSTGQDF